MYVAVYFCLCVRVCCCILCVFSVCVLTNFEVRLVSGEAMDAREH